mgnify:CR=1 FL=1
MAKLSLVSDGIDFAIKQIAIGVTAFAPVITDDLDIFRQVLLTHHLKILAMRVTTMRMKMKMEMKKWSQQPKEISERLKP